MPSRIRPVASDKPTPRPTAGKHVRRFGHYLAAALLWAATSLAIFTILLLPDHALLAVLSASGAVVVGLIAEVGR